LGQRHALISLSFARLALILAVACVAAAHADPAQVPEPHQQQVIVVRRGWHIDVGFAVTDLEQPLRSIASDLPTARFIFFGFGDMHYLMSKNHGSGTLAAALWPGRGLMLVTGLQGTPQQGFGANEVIELRLADHEAHSLQEFVWQSFVTADGAAPVYRPGPYENSLYFLAVRRYSALHTCNTWAAEALKAAHLHVHSGGVMFAGQVWSQARRLQRQQAAARQQARAPSVALKRQGAEQGAE
jgi:hypothetical protein